MQNNKTEQVNLSLESEAFLNKYNRNKIVATYTLGCKVNHYETEAITELFKNMGYEIVDFDDFADVYIINTCTVTNMSDRKSRQMIRRAKKHNAESIVAVTGCYAQTAPDDVIQIDGVNLVVGTKERKDFVQMVESLMSTDKQLNVNNIMDTHTFEELQINEYTDRTRAYIKIQEGCNQFCTYCIIPYARGPIRSRKFEDIIKEIQVLSDKGFAEIVLAGIHVASYGADLGDTSLADLLVAVDKIEKIKRIRLSSIEPMTLDDSFIEKINSCKKLCRHFHISLQSGSDSVLRRMNRRYTTDEFKNIVLGLRKAFPDVAITTDIMLGFPGETDAEFQETVDFVEGMNFADAHIFQYSPRKGTPASKMKEQIDSKVKEERSKKIIDITQKSRHEFLKKVLGATVDVLFEQEYKSKSGFYEGKTDNYITVICKSDVDLSGQYRTVKLVAIDGDVIRGSFI